MFVATLFFFLPIIPLTYNQNKHSFQLSAAGHFSNVTIHSSNIMANLRPDIIAASLNLCQLYCPEYLPAGS